MYFGQGQDFKLTTELPEKVQYSRKLYFQDRTLRLSGNQALTLYEGDSIF